MPLVIAVWENNTISVVWMQSGFDMVDLWFEIDNEADPALAKCYKVFPDEDGMHMAFNWKYDSGNENVCPLSKNLYLEKISGKSKRLRWPKDIQNQVRRRLRSDSRYQMAAEARRYLSADQIPKMPAPPPPMFTACEVRSMTSFSGVYFAFNKDGTCHYVGESRNVPCRVSASRPEIGDRRIGLIRCAEHERKIIESYFVGILNPPGNGISTHRMLKTSDASTSGRCSASKADRSD